MSAGQALQLAVLEHLHLLLDRLEAGAAVLEQLGAAAIAREQALERQLAASIEATSDSSSLNATS